jgi:mono/diheme cytochrome c family protein
MKSFLVLLSAGLVAGALAACGNSDDSTDDTGTGTGTTDNAAAIADGLSIVQANACMSCHGSDLSGSIMEPAGNFSANITPDQATGIGSWTLADLTNALRDSVDDQGQPLCAPMPKFSAFTDTQIADVYAYLRSIPAVSKAQPDTDCSGNPVSN